MSDVNLLAVGAVAVAVLVLSTVYYIAFTKQLAELSPAYADAADQQPAPWKVGIELVRNLVLASVVALLAGLIGIAGWTGGLKLGLVLWLDFPIVLWTGAVMWEKVPTKLAAIHADNWLLKLVVIALVVSVWN